MSFKALHIHASGKDVDVHQMMCLKRNAIIRERGQKGRHKQNRTMSATHCARMASPTLADTRTADASDNEALEM